MKTTAVTLFSAAINLYICTAGLSQNNTLNTADKYVWNLSAIYKDGAQWQTEAAAIAADISKMKTLKGMPVRNAAELNDLMTRVKDLRSRAGKLVIYSVLVFETNNQSAEASANYITANDLEARVEAAVSFIREKVISIGPKKIRTWLLQEPGLAQHRQRLNRILLEAPHTLAADEQKIIESVAAYPRTYGDIYDRITQSETGWPRIITSAGDTITANLNSMLDMRRTGESKDKNAVESAFLKQLDVWINTFSLLYTSRINGDLIIARQKKFDDGISAIWQLRDGMPASGYQAMLDVMRANSDVLKKYARLRIKALGLTENSYASFMSGLPGFKFRIPVDSAMKISLKALSPVGKNYQAILEKYLAKPDWMHLAPMENKNPTYAIFPAIGGIPSYFLQTYRGSYNNARNFTGALALAIAFNNVPAANKPDTRDDPGIFSNALIYCGRVLFDDYMLKQPFEKKDRITQLLSSLEMLWRFFQTGIIMELDIQVQERIKNNKTPSGNEISNMYFDLLKQYYGGNDGLHIQEYFKNEWITEPVTFSTYEHQFWCPAIAAGCTLAGNILNGDEKAKQSMYNYLGTGDVDLSNQLFLRAGIDLTSKKTYETLIAKMKKITGELEVLLSDK